MAEREGFYYRRFQQVTVKPALSDNNQCLHGFQALHNVRYSFYSFSYSLQFR
jgi:hypothetical protein